MKSFEEYCELKYGDGSDTLSADQIQEAQEDYVDYVYFKRDEYEDRKMEERCQHFLKWCI